MNATGKKARKQHGGNKYDLKRAGRSKRLDKRFNDGKITPSEYQLSKARHKELVNG